jgi:hypothetical protein
MAISGGLESCNSSKKKLPEVSSLEADKSQQGPSAKKKKMVAATSSRLLPTLKELDPHIWQ